MKNTHFLFWLLLSLIISFKGFSQDVDLEVYTTGLDQPVDIQNAGDDRLFIVEQEGRIRIIDANKELLSEPFLNITNRVLSSGNEQGLLGLAFHPDYENNNYFYVNYTRGSGSGETVIARYTATDDNTADPDSEVILLTYNQPARNHNGGALAFGPDGKLYISSGDGGGGGDQFNNGQNTASALGALLRLDVDIPSPYIPDDNPFVGTAGNDVIWAYGLRNPWKFSFDFETNNLWIGDVGDNNPELTNEEVDKIQFNQSKEANFGWPCYEGTNPFKTEQCDNNAMLIFPSTEYARANGRCSVTGGYVYRGTQFPSLVGSYIFADYCSSEIFLFPEDAFTFSAFKISDDFLGISSFGENNQKELFAASRSNGTIYQVVDNDIVLNIPSAQKSEFLVTQDIKERTFTINSVNDLSVGALEIYNLQGQLINTLLPLASTSNRYSTQGFAKGLYLIHKKLDNGTIFVHKIVM